VSYVPSLAKKNHDDHYFDFLTCGMVAHDGNSAFIGRLNEQLKDKKDDFDINLIERDLKRAEKTSVLLNDLFYANAVDNFNAYLSDIILEILKVDPRPIYGKSVEAKNVFEITDIDSLKSEIIDKTIIDLGYQNINDLGQFLSKNFGIRTLSHWLSSRRLNRIIQIRNIIAHNRGIVNRLFLQRSGSKSDILHQHVKVGHALRTAGYLEVLINKIDREAVLKFNLVGVQDV
jgi:hypothetical protein